MTDGQSEPFVHAEKPSTPSSIDLSTNESLEQVTEDTTVIESIDSSDTQAIDGRSTQRVVEMDNDYAVQYLHNTNSIDATPMSSTSPKTYPPFTTTDSPNKQCATVTDGDESNEVYSYQPLRYSNSQSLDHSIDSSGSFHGFNNEDIPAEIDIIFSGHYTFSVDVINF